MFAALISKSMLVMQNFSGPDTNAALCPLDAQIDIVVSTESVTRLAQPPAATIHQPRSSSRPFFWPARPTAGLPVVANGVAGGRCGFHRFGLQRVEQSVVPALSGRCMRLRKRQAPHRPPCRAGAMPTSRQCRLAAVSAGAFAASSNRNRASRGRSSSRSAYGGLRSPQKAGRTCRAVQCTMSSGRRSENSCPSRRIRIPVPGARRPGMGQRGARIEQNRPAVRSPWIAVAAGARNDARPALRGALLTRSGCRGIEHIAGAVAEPQRGVRH